jgi:hypothetical protein
MIVAQWIKKFPIFYGTRGFIIVFTKLTTTPYPERLECRPCPHILFFKTIKICV